MPSRPILILDFDGTVSLGDGPVLAYARAVERLGGTPAGFADEVATALAGAIGDAIDGYDLVRVAADRAGVDERTLAAAYLSSRDQLGGPGAPISAPPGLAAFLASADADRVLVTNAPPVRLTEALAVLGLDGRFDLVVTDAGKPAGLGALLDELAAGRPGARILSVGDVWRNDLAPAHERGHATALVGRFADPTATPDFRAERLESLYPAITSWLAEASGPMPAAAGPAPIDASRPLTAVTEE